MGGDTTTLATCTEDRPLGGDVALVTGGGRGIGRAAAQALGRAGARVAVLARSAPEIDETVELVESRGGTGIAVAADVTDGDVPARAVVLLASGRADSLSGRWLDARDDLDAVVAGAATALRDDLYQLRPRRPARAARKEALDDLRRDGHHSDAGTLRE